MTRALTLNTHTHTNRTYLLFSHTIKAQAENMPLLDACLARRVRLLDYECITETGERGGPRCVSRVCFVASPTPHATMDRKDPAFPPPSLSNTHTHAHNANTHSLVYFGRFAGMAGMIDALQAVGQNLLARGFSTPFLHSPAAYT